ncbi:hypothetical protein JMUB5695_03058 [Mycobacterium heckeshornense]|uniref:hypothetical protein n=1 Tax=Mycobacterium heckeshornense TaxID=110505 RepID=UPI001941D585|nr:hypothetical protein [Mycobacterium heckeshornense]BCQ09609.1 hypothetical protein JMUB5695_03058 [Mycobacterium heckeshornense]
MDEIATLKHELADMGYVTMGSRNQPRVNPILSALDQHRKTADQLVVSLALPMEGEILGQRRGPAAKQSARPGQRKIKTGARIHTMDRMRQQREA